MRSSDPAPPPPPTVFAPRHAGAVKPIAQDSNGDLFSQAATTSENGHSIWQEQQKAAKQALGRQWGVPLGHRVRVQLSSQGQPLEGILRLATDRLDNLNRHDRFLRVGDVLFSPHDIESITRLNA